MVPLALPVLGSPRFDSGSRQTGAFDSKQFQMAAGARTRSEKDGVKRGHSTFQPLFA